MDSFGQALTLLLSQDTGLWQIVMLSLGVSLSALAIGLLIGVPLGAVLAIKRFTGRRAIVIALNSLMGLPSVIVGVLVYLLFSRSGAFGSMGWLFTPAAMVVAQSCLTTPLIAALSRQSIEDAWFEHRDVFRSLRLTTLQTARWLILHLGRALSEVGAVMIVGGNIAGHTRTMTTAIALETSKGDLALALALGLVLMLIVLGLNAIGYWIKHNAMRRYG
jgi:tungstate transport system permease protein